MQRAKRDAANPMRVIQEAARLARRRGERLEEPVPAAVPAARRVTSRSLASDRPPADEIVEPLPGAELALVAAGAGKPAATDIPDSGTTAAVPPNSVATATALVGSPALGAPMAETVAPPPAPPVATPAATPAARDLTLAAVPPNVFPPVAAPPPAAPPKLISMVEPAIPLQVRDRMHNLREMAADLTIRADGTVAAVVLPATAPPQARRYVVQALEQWRFEPMAGERMHRVVLVFNDAR